MPTIGTLSHQQNFLQVCFKLIIFQSYFIETVDEGGVLSLLDFQNAQNKTFLEITVDNEFRLNNASNSMIFEGDLLTDESDNLISGNESLHDLITQEDRKWDLRSGPFIIIPYTIPSGLTDQERAEIARAIWELRSKTCIKCV